MTRWQPVARNEFAKLVQQWRPRVRNNPIAVAVSGGADSMALCALLAEAFGPERVYALTVDHQLRSNSREEAEEVARIVRDKIGAHHQLLTIHWPDGKAPTAATLETKAREERYALLADACRRFRTQTLFMGHHADDRHETTLFRLARASGVYGLSGMNHSAHWPFPYADTNTAHLQLARPLLDLPKASCRDVQRLVETCRAEGLDWVEDPTNQSSDHQRNVIRATLAEIRAQSPTPPLSFAHCQAFCQHMQGHRTVIDEQVNRIIESRLKFDKVFGVAWLQVDRTFLQTTPRVVRHRLLSLMIQRLRASLNPPRLVQLEQIDQQLRAPNCPRTSSLPPPFSTAGLIMLPATQSILNSSKAIPRAWRSLHLGCSVWLFIPQPPSRAEQVRTLSQFTEIAAATTADRDSRHLTADWYQYRLYLRVSPESANRLDVSRLTVQPFSARSDTPRIAKLVDYMSPTSRRLWRLFSAQPTLLRNSHPVVVDTKTRQFLALPTLSVSFIPGIFASVQHKSLYDLPDAPSNLRNIHRR